MNMLPATACLAVIFIVLSLMTAYYAYSCHLQAHDALIRAAAAERAFENQKATIIRLHKEAAEAKKALAAQWADPEGPH